MLLATCGKCGESVYTSDEIVSQSGENYHYESTPEGYFDTHNKEDEA